MKLMLASLVLNEAEWLLLNWRQHREWPEMVRWVFVEGADVSYDRELVTADGLSTDGTTAILDRLAAEDPRVTVIHHGWMQHANRAQAKCQGRNRYFEVADEVRPDLVATVDADEFYTRRDQEEIVRMAKGLGTFGRATMLKQRHVWRPESVASQPLFKQEVVGGYWSVPHCRLWRWQRGMRHTDNHNYPGGVGVPTRIDLLGRHEDPVCVHMGYASSGKSRQAKSRYYVARGEGSEEGRLGNSRRMYVACRDAHERWKPGDTLPAGARVVPWTWPVPEVFKEQQDVR